MNVLIVHNAYQQRGGEDSVVESEAALLRQRGHDVAVLLRHNDDVKNISRLRLAVDLIWATRTEQDVEAYVESFRPDVIHLHNTLPLISPSVYWAASRFGIPVVQTLHNFRLLCPQATLLRDGNICEECVGRLPWPSIVHRCYRDSRIQSAAVTMMLGIHRGIGTYRNKVSRYIALTDFGRDKFIDAGFDPLQIDVKPNFVDWIPPPRPHLRRGGLYVGRLSAEKGIEVLLKALASYQGQSVVVIGGGPFENQVRATVGVKYEGALSLPDVMQRMQKAAYLVLPSTCYEGFPRTLVEAFASGLPVIASRHGPFVELIRHGITGLLFAPGDARDLENKLVWADTHAEEMLEMGLTARREYEEKYTPDRNAIMLEAIYKKAMSNTVPI